MRFRTLSTALLVSAFALAACDGDHPTGIDDNATVQFINASSDSLDVTVNGVVATGGSGLRYSTSSACMSIDPASSGLAVRETRTSDALPGFTPAFTAGGNYTVIAYPGTSGTMQFVTLSNEFTPASGQAGLRVANVGPAGSSYDVHVTAPGAALGAPNANNLVVGTGSSYFDVSATSAQHISVTNAGTQTVVADFGSSNTFTAGRNSTLVITTLGSGATLPSGFFVAGC